MNSSSDNVTSVNDVNDFRTLIVTIMDYYCFNNGIIKDDYESEDYSEDDEDEEKWQKLIKVNETPLSFPENTNTNQVIPSHIHKLVEKSFEAQLNKFI